MKVYFKSPIVEIFLAQVIIYLILWLTDSYLAIYLTLVLGAIFSAVFVISLISEWLSETTPVPRKYFYIVSTCIIAPVLTTLLALYVIGIEYPL